MKQTATLVVAVVVAAGGLALPGARAAEDPAKAQLKYPAARRDATVDTYFSTSVPTPYQWMEGLDSPALKRWIEAEDAVTFSYLEEIPIRAWIYERLQKLWDYARETTPQQVAGGRIFFTRNSGLQKQSVLYVADSANAAPRALLDPNALSPDGSIALLGPEPSPHGAMLAYDLSQGGSDWVTIHVRDVTSGKDLPDTIRWVKFSAVAWTEDGKGFFYSRYPAPPEGKAISQKVTDQKLYYHQLGTEQTADALIYERPDLPGWVIRGSVSEDGRYLFISLQNGTAVENELFCVDLKDPQKPDVGGPVTPLYTKNDAAYDVAGTVGKTLFLRTTLQSPRGRVVTASLDDPDPARWRVVVPEGEGVIRSAALAGGHVLVNSQVVAKSRLSLYSTTGQAEGEVALPALGSVSRVSARADSNIIYFSFASFLLPVSVYRYDVTSGKKTAYFKPEVPFDPFPYEVKQVFYPSKDGTRIPMFIVARKNLKLDGNNPTILYAYGGFNITVTPTFNAILPVWLELGGVYAVPNLRGGGEFGESWHEAGMLDRKQNVFDDFAWAAKYLIAQGYTSSKRLGIQGYSNGGLLVGASITQNPGLFGAAYAGAGVLDMLRYQKFSGGALWAPEYGTSDNERAFRWLLAYSPLANLKPGTCYPPTIITTADHDDRVVPSHSYKFAAALQHDQGCTNPVLIRVETKTSHGYMPTDKRIAQTADVWAFEAYNLGITEGPKSGDGVRR